jgi:hypothetical protein
MVMTPCFIYSIAKRYDKNKLSIDYVKNFCYNINNKERRVLMGMSLRMYYGPVFKIKMFEREFNKNINTCSNVDCKRHGIEINDSKFCLECGSPIRPKTFIEYRKIDGLEGLDEKFCDLAVPFGANNPLKIDSKKYKIYVPDYRFSPHEIHIQIDEGEFYTPLKEMQFDQIMNDFLNHDFSKELLEEYKKHIPEENIDVEFSMFSYFL